jgi:serine/threonine-protein kinase HipA
MRFQVFQWLIGATDGHAKNFSIYLEAGGTFRLTPFYDILSAYPLLGGNGLDIRKLSLAMGLVASKGRKYKLYLIQPRHFINTAKAAGFDPARMQQIIAEFVEIMPGAITRLQQRMDAQIPEQIYTAIFGQTLKQITRLRSSML